MKFFFSKKPTESRESTQSTFTDDNALAETIAKLLLKVIESNKPKGSPKDKYSCVTPPLTSIKDYLLRFMKYISQEESIYIIMLIYLNTYLENNKESYITEFNVHRLLACCILLAHKFHSEEIYKNEYISRVVGIPLLGLNQLELKFYKELNYTLLVSTEKYEACRQDVLYYQRP